MTILYLRADQHKPIILDIIGRVMTDHLLKEQGSNLCQSCGLCCNGVVCDVALISPQKDKQFAERFAQDILASKDGQRFWINLPCPAYKGNCSQYEMRPLDCRSYQCALLQKLAFAKITFEQASEIVSLTLSTQDKLAAQYKAKHAQPVTPNEVYPLLMELQRQAQENHAQKAFWRDYPDFLTMLFLRKKHFLK